MMDQNVTRCKEGVEECMGWSGGDCHTGVDDKCALKR